MNNKELKESIKDFTLIERNYIYYIYIQLLVYALTFLFRVWLLQVGTIFEKICKF